MYKICDICGEKTSFGYIIDDDLECYCSDDCLWGAYSEEEYDELCQENRAYWLDWGGML